MEEAGGNNGGGDADIIVNADGPAPEATPVVDVAVEGDEEGREEKRGPVVGPVLDFRAEEEPIPCFSAQLLKRLYLTRACALGRCQDTGTRATQVAR